MCKHLPIVLFTTSLVTAACGLLDDDVSSSSRAIIETDCASDGDCPTGFECEIEEEHGTTWSYCQAHEDHDGSCPPGYELEIEHGQAYCEPHGGSGSGSGSLTCTTDADCGAGMECEIEEEHGQTWSYCKPHGGG